MLESMLKNTAAKTIEARAAAEQESYKSQVELAKAVADNRSTIEGFQGVLGLKTQRGAAQSSVDIQMQALNQRQNIPNSNIPNSNAPTKDERPWWARGTAEEQSANFRSEFANKIATRDPRKAGDELSIIKQLQTNIEEQRGFVVDPLGPNNAPSNILELPYIKDLMSQLAALDSSFNISNNVLELSGSLMNLRSSIERGLINSLDVLESQFKLVGSQVDITSKKLSEQKATLESLTGKLYGGTPADNSMNKMTLSRAAGNANDIAAAIKRAIPNANGLTGVNTILTDANVARLVENQIAGKSAKELTELMNFSREVSANELTQSGLSGDQVSAAIQAALASRPEFKSLGIDVKTTDIKSTVDQANKLIQDAQKIATEIQSARMQMDKSTSANLSIMNDQVSSLTAAISAIPKQINVVISGIRDISVTFDLTKVEESMRTVGDKVFDNVIGKLREVFKASNIPLPGF